VENIQSSGKIIRLKFEVFNEPYGFINKILVMNGAKPLVIKRISIGPIKMEKLPPGGYRPLSNTEIKKIEDYLNV
jgi:16S rRNA U516 pseudouridylate synthase RsuA-like enzyme